MPLPEFESGYCFSRFAAIVVHLRFRLGNRYPRFEPGHSIQARMVAALLPAWLDPSSWPDRNPHFDATRISEVLRHDADDCVALAIEA